MTQDGKENPKYRGVYGRAIGHIAESLLVAAKEKHKVMRGILAEGFSSRAVRGHEKLIMAHVDTMIQQLKHIYHEKVNENQEHDGEINRTKAIKIDLNQWLYWYATDVITDLTIGESLHGLRNLETAPCLQFLTVAPKLLLKAAVLSHLGLGAMVDVMAQIFAGKFSQMSADLTQRLKSQHGRKLEKRGDLAELMTEANKIRVCH